MGFKTGQKKKTPDKEDPLRKFYTSLMKQKPNSKMAMKWCLKYGIFSEKSAQKVILLLQVDELHI